MRESGYSTFQVQYTFRVWRKAHDRLIDVGDAHFRSPPIMGEEILLEGMPAMRVVLVDTSNRTLLLE